jgi:hypothetical protein
MLRTEVYTRMLEGGDVDGAKLVAAHVLLKAEECLVYADLF